MLEHRNQVIQANTSTGTGCNEAGCGVPVSDARRSQAFWQARLGETSGNCFLWSARAWKHKIGHRLSEWPIWLFQNTHSISVSVYEISATTVCRYSQAELRHCNVRDYSALRVLSTAPSENHHHPIIRHPGRITVCKWKMVHLYKVPNFGILPKDTATNGPGEPRVEY